MVSGTGLLAVTQPSVTALNETSGIILHQGQYSTINEISRCRDSKTL